MPNTTPDMLGYRMLQRTLLVIAALVVLIQILFLGFALNKSRERCEDVQAIRSYILTATERSLRATPTLAYYKAHPRELADALETLRAQRDTFADPLRCPIF